MKKAKVHLKQKIIYLFVNKIKEYKKREIMHFFK